MVVELSLAKVKIKWSDASRVEHFGLRGEGRPNDDITPHLVAHTSHFTTYCPRPPSIYDSDILFLARCKQCPPPPDQSYER